MLNAMRRHATGWVAKALFVLLIASFAVWGIGDFVTGPRATGSVATVAGEGIEEQELLRAFDTRYRELQEQAGGDLTRHQAASFGLMHQALDGAIAQRLLALHARDLGLTVDGAAVATAIRENPSFQGAQGFDRELLNQFLRSINLNEETFVAAVRGDMVRERLVNAVAEPAQAPESLAKRLLDYREERRRGRALTVAADAIQVEPPDEAALKAYLEAHARQYEAPEYRAVTLLSFGADDLSEEIALDEAAVRSEYDRRLEDFRTPAQRQLDQLLAPDEATARRGAELARGGQSLEAVAAELASANVERTELDAIRRGDLPDALGQAVWNVPVGGITDPIETPFGWHVVQVVAEQPEILKPFEAVREDIARELRRERATDRLPDLATALDDEIAAGTPLDQAAEKLGLPLLRIEAIDRQGQNEAEEAVAADRITPEMLGEIFAAPQGEPSLLNQTADGRNFMFRVDGIKPARPRALDEVREEVTAAWITAEQNKRAQAKAEELLQRAGNAADLDRLAAENPGTSLRPIEPIKRDDQGFLSGLRPDAVSALFATEPGRVAGRVVPVLDGWALIATEEVLPAAADQAAVAKVQEALTSAWKTDLLQSYETALRDRYEVEVNQNVLARLLEAQAQ